MKWFVLLTLLSVSLFGQSLKGNNFLKPGEESYRLFIHLQQELLITVDDGKVTVNNKSRTVHRSLTAKLEEFSFSHVVSLSKDEKDILKRGLPLKRQAGFDRKRVSGLIELEGAQTLACDSLLRLAEILETFPEVLYCELVPVTPDAPTQESNRNTPPVFDIWEDQQTYLYGEQDSDIQGIDAQFAHDQGITGQGISLSDIEWGFTYTHEEFNEQNVVELIATTNTQYNNHGTAVMGILFAGKNAYGVTGAAYGADAFYGISEIGAGDRPSAIAAALDTLEAGDILIYEMQTSKSPTGQLVPADYSQSVWTITKEATDAGIIVIAAAGNGNANLDSLPFKAYMDRGDNGSIIVGAAANKGRSRMAFSTHGSRINLCGIGEKVYSTGYGDLMDWGVNEQYTKSFNGTSSATPIVAAAAVLVQSYAKERFNITLTPLEMRELLIATGISCSMPLEESGWNVETPFPNVKRAIQKLEKENGVTHYSLSVAGGSGTGDYSGGTIIRLNAKDSIGGIFDKWEGDSEFLDDATAQTAKLTMPTKSVSLTAVFKDSERYTLTVVDGIGTGKYPEGKEVTITANDSIGYRFVGWEGDTTHIVNTYRKSTSLIMPDSSIEVKPRYDAFDMTLLSRSHYTVYSVGSEYSKTSGPDKAIDSLTNTYWASKSEPNLPDEGTFCVKLKEPIALQGLSVMPHQDPTTVGRIKKYVVEVSIDGTQWEQVAEGVWETTPEEKFLKFEEPTSKVQYLRIKPYLETVSQYTFIAIAEFNLYSEQEVNIIDAPLKKMQSSFSLTHKEQTLLLTSEKNGVKDVSLFSLNGRNVFNTSLIVQKGVNQIQLPQLATGVYLIRISDIDRVSTYRMLIK